MGAIEGLIGLVLVAGGPYLWFHHRHPTWWKTVWRLKKTVIVGLAVAAAFVLYSRLGH